MAKNREEFFSVIMVKVVSYQIGEITDQIRDQGLLPDNFRHVIAKLLMEMAANGIHNHNHQDRDRTLDEQTRLDLIANRYYEELTDEINNTFPKE